MGINQDNRRLELSSLGRSAAAEISETAPTRQSAELQTLWFLVSHLAHHFHFVSSLL